MKAIIRRAYQRANLAVKKIIIACIPAGPRLKTQIMKKIYFQHRNEDEQRLLGYLSGNVAGFIPSYALSQHDEASKPSSRLLALALEAGNCARTQVDLTEISRNFPPEMQDYILTWPGEHYRLLAALVKIVKPKVIIEIGTFTGASCLSLKQYLPVGGRITTFDIVPWEQHPESGLTAADFDSGLQQVVADLTQGPEQAKHRELIQAADLIFVDAAKDGRTEKKLCAFFDSTKFKNSPIVIFDDIRFINMIRIWRELKHPKLDLTSLGHWSGTGMVEWI